MINNNTTGERTFIRDGERTSIWQSAPVSATTSALYNADSVYDVLVVGAGITGLTAALQLQQAGKKCIVADAHTVGFGTTGGTSAHINTFADTTFSQAAKNFGDEGAQLFAGAINDGFSIIRKNISDLNIDCDFQSMSGYVYAEDEKQARELKDICEGAEKVGVAVTRAAAVPIPVPYVDAIGFPHQAQFHPLKYLAGVQAAFIAAGGLILEHSRVEKVESENNVHTVQAGVHTVRASAIIFATHIPPGLTVFNLRCAAYRSYVLALTLTDGNYPDALIYDMQEPYHYFRTHEVDGQKYLLVGGNDHKTGEGKPEDAFAELEAYARKYYNVGSVAYKWSSQYYVPVDGFPYIGAMPERSEGIYCATGFNGNGMMLGSVAASILTDMVMGKENKYSKLFDPARMKPIAGFKEFIRENADSAYQFVASRFTGQHIDSLGNIPNDSGAIVEFEGNKLAVYRDVSGNVHALNPVCTHALCIVGWNSEEKSWDCPCHGARYDIDGKVLTGPADRDLEKVDIS